MSRLLSKSVNSGISEELSSLSYTSVDDVAKVVALLGKSRLLAKVDIKSTYSSSLRQNATRHGMVGICLCGYLLAIWTSIIPKNFHSPGRSDLVGNTAFRGLHYLDNYITIGAPGSLECAANMATLLELCRRLGVTLAMEKCEGTDLPGYQD